ARAFFKGTVPTAGSGSAAGNTPISSTIQAGPTPINQSSIKMFVDNLQVTPVITHNGADTILSYQPSQILTAGSQHSARIEAADTGVPPRSITNAWSFTVISYATLP